LTRVNFIGVFLKEIENQNQVLKILKILRIWKPNLVCNFSSVFLAHLPIHWFIQPFNCENQPFTQLEAYSSGCTFLSDIFVKGKKPN